ncbi:hypothetical protein NM688_g391 [Phlebia brevispora]|uniref:Uncharacterized protein n=1 Tax=Phlebia brevispora TaxID=194682 RepID=A0ACC1TEF2_9APHY|nr:hypothetical protein NM688_g391 [Phlebia brevispora]
MSRFATPPPSDLTNLTLSTPTAHRDVHDPRFQEAKLDLKREAHCSDAGPFSREVCPDWFCTSVLPPLRDDINLCHVIDGLISKDVIKGGRFSTFQLDPKEIEGNENVIFRERLQTLVGSIVKTARTPTTKPTMKFYHNGEKVPRSYIRKNKTRPDSYGLLLTAPQGEKDPVHWIDLGLLGEVKKVDTEGSRGDDEVKLAWNMHYCLCEDPRRRFIFAFTIENTEMRLWFCSRQNLIITRAFNFITDCSRTVYFFLTLMFATTYRLGWDPTMTRCPDGQYDIKVYSAPNQFTHYRTLQLVSDYEVDSTFGRGARMWKVRRLDATGQPYGEPLTLRDYWIEFDRPREGATYRRLRDANSSDSYQALLDDFFCAVVIDGDVYIEEEQQYDNSHTLALHDAVVPEGSPIFTFKGAKGIDTGAVGNYPIKKVLKADIKGKLTLEPLVHYRIVVEETLRPLHELCSVGKIFTALGHVCAALQAMHEQGLVHRNVCPENIMVDSSRIRLTGLEQVKHMQDTSIHTERIVSSNFTAVEVAWETWAFGKGEPVPSSSESYSYSASVVETDVAGTVHQAILAVPFRYNPLHDLESVWWVAVYVMVKREAQDSNPDASHLLAKEKLDPFCSETSKELYLKGSRSLKNILDTRDNQSIKYVATVLSKLQSLLQDTYKCAEQDPSRINEQVAREAIVQFRKAFLKMASHFEENDIILAPHGRRDRSTEGAKQPQPGSRPKKQSPRVTKPSGLNAGTRKRTQLAVAPANDDRKKRRIS